MLHIYVLSPVKAGEVQQPCDVPWLDWNHAWTVQATACCSPRGEAAEVRGPLAKSLLRPAELALCCSSLR